MQEQALVMIAAEMQVTQLERMIQRLLLRRIRQRAKRSALLLLDSSTEFRISIQPTRTALWRASRVSSTRRTCCNQSSRYLLAVTTPSLSLAEVVQITLTIVEVEDQRQEAMQITVLEHPITLTMVIVGATLPPAPITPIMASVVITLIIAEPPQVQMVADMPTILEALEQEVHLLLSTITQQTMAEEAREHQQIMPIMVLEGLVITVLPLLRALGVQLPFLKRRPYALPPLTMA